MVSIVIVPLLFQYLVQAGSCGATKHRIPPAYTKIRLNKQD
jgi:hypothetical protein